MLILTYFNRLFNTLFRSNLICDAYFVSLARQKFHPVHSSHFFIPGILRQRRVRENSASEMEARKICIRDESKITSMLQAAPRPRVSAASGAAQKPGVPCVSYASRTPGSSQRSSGTGLYAAYLPAASLPSERKYYMIMSPKVGKSRLRQLSNACSLTTEYSL